MDYIYANINNKLIDDDTENNITWTPYDRLPEPSKDLYMTVAVINTNGSDQIYLCVKRGSTYIWKLICSAGGQLASPIIELEGTIVHWNSVQEAISYLVYINDILVQNTTSTQYDLSEIITEAGTYVIYVVAKAAAGSDYGDSEPSNYIEYIKADSYFKFVSEDSLTEIPDFAEKHDLPEDFKVNGLTINYKTVGEQYEYLAYPTKFNQLVDVVQSGQHVLGNYTKLEDIVKDNIEYHLYRTTLQQVYDDSDYTYYTFRIN